MLSEAARVRLVEWDQLAIQDIGGYSLPALTVLDGSVWVADLVYVRDPEDLFETTWTGIRLMSEDGSIRLIPVVELEPVGRIGTMWLLDGQGTLVAAILATPGSESSVIVLYLVTINPEDGSYTIDTVPTGQRAIDFAERAVVEQTEEGLALRTHVENPEGVGRNKLFEALLTPGGEWVFSQTPIPPSLGWDVHGWVCGDWYVAEAPEIGAGEVTRIPAPEGHPAYQTAAIYRRHPGSSSPLLVTGWYVEGGGEGGPPLTVNNAAYDICIYTSNAVLPKGLWEGELRDDGWHPDWGSGTLAVGIIPELQGDRIVLINPADPDDPWAWATLPPGAGLNDWMAFYVDGDWVQVHYGGRVVLVWRMPPSVYQHFLAGGASMGFYNSITKQWQAEPPPGWPPAKPAPLNGWAYAVDSRHWVSETGDLLTRYGTRIDADDVLVFPGDYALVGQALQDDVIQSAPIKHIAGRDLPEVVLSRDDALLVWDAGYGHYLYPVEEAA